jgi:hypothetical protein
MNEGIKDYVSGQDKTASHYNSYIFFIALKTNLTTLAGKH